MSAALLGQGWRFPIKPDPAGSLSYIAGDALVEQSLRVLLLTPLGARVMQAALGCRAPSLVFAPGSVQFLSLLEASVRDAIRDWEPRVTVDAVRAEADAAEPWRVTVSVAYLVRRSNTRQTMVFPFYLAEGGAR